MRSCDLGKKLFGERAGGFAEENAFQVLAVAEGFFEQFDAFDGALAFGGEFGAAEGLAQVFEACIVASGDRAEAAVFDAGRAVCVGFMFGKGWRGSGYTRSRKETMRAAEQNLETQRARRVRGGRRESARGSRNAEKSAVISL